MYKNLKVSVVIPALNEELAIGKVISECQDLTHNEQTVVDSIVVCDNGSNDSTAAIALSLNAKVVSQSKPGYGIACLTAISALDKCDVVLFVDGDDSVNLIQALDLLEGIHSGADLTIGSRCLGHVEEKALTPPQQYGNHLAAFLISLFWHQKITDLGPFRAIRFDVLNALNMQELTFGWTAEMQIKAISYGFSVKEFPADAKTRLGESKISGTVRGTILAGYGILSIIIRMAIKSLKKNDAYKHCVGKVKRTFCNHQNN